MAARRPNIVILMADDLGFGDLGMCSFGGTRTPHIDALATDGVFLTQHYSASPICAPARAAFMTGRYPQRAGVIDTFPHRGLDRLALREQTIGDLFGRIGYRTGLIGKWHSGAIGDEFHPNARGFDDFVGFRGGGQDYWDWRLERNGSPFGPDGRYITDVMTAEAIRFVRENREDPFLLFVAYTAPHGPFQAPDDAIAAVRSRRHGPDTVDVIAAMVEVMDRGVGQVLDELDRLELADDTLVMFTSDNGPWMREGGFDETTVRFNLGLAGGKELVHEGGIRVPMILRWPPAITAGRRVDEVVHFTDWLPTLLALVGEPGLDRLPGDGRDVSSLLTSGAAPPEIAHYWHWTRYEPRARCNAAVRDGNWKLRYPPVPEVLRILASDQTEARRLRLNPDTYRPPVGGFERAPDAPSVLPNPQLFDLAADPGEQFDVADAQRDRVQVLQRSLDRWFAEVEQERSLLEM